MRLISQANVHWPGSLFVTLGPFARSPIRPTSWQSNLVGRLFWGLIFPKLLDAFWKLVRAHGPLNKIALMLQTSLSQAA